MPRLPLSPANRTSTISWLLFLFIFLLAAYFRTVNLGSSPGWYSDEGNFIDLADNWAEGHWENYGVIGAPYIQRPPLYMYALSLAFRTGGVDIVTARGLSVFYSLISLLLVFLMVREREGNSLALLASGIYAIAPWIVAFNRFALSYNQLMPCFLLAGWAGLRIQRGGGPGWLWVGALASAAAIVTDYLGAILALVFLAALLAWQRRWMLPAMAIMAAGVLAAVLPLLLTAPGLFIQDSLFTLTHRTTGTAAGGTILSLIVNYGELLRSTSWILAALAGLFLLQDRGLQALLLGGVGLTLLVVMRTYTPVGVGLHYLMHLFPFFAVGLAAFVRRAFRLVLDTFFSLSVSLLARLKTEHLRYWVRLGWIFLAGAVVVTPLVWMLFASAASFTFNTPLLFNGRDELYLVSAADARKARTFLLEHLSDDDLVIGSPALVWKLPGKNADFMTALHEPLTSPDRETVFIPLSAERFVYDSDYQQAAYILFDKLALEFAPLVLPGMDQLILDVQANWQQVFQSGDIVVYHNPFHQVQEQ